MSHWGRLGDLQHNSHEQIAVDGHQLKPAAHVWHTVQSLLEITSQLFTVQGEERRSNRTIRTLAEGDTGTTDTVDGEC